MWEGWACLGGTEIVNNAMAIQFAQTSPCPINWIDDEACPGIYDMLSETRGEVGPYSYDTLPDTAPWFDDSIPDSDLSERFLGIYCISMDGIDDSTRAADVAERVTKGAVIGAQRKASRAVRFRVLLSAMDQDALNYGLSWLDSRLKEKGCSTHGGSCGTSDLSVFTTCSPAYNPPGHWISPDPVWVSDGPDEIVHHDAVIVAQDSTGSQSGWVPGLIDDAGSGAQDATFDVNTTIGGVQAFQIRTSGYVDSGTAVDPVPSVQALKYIGVEWGQSFTVTAKVDTGSPAAQALISFGGVDSNAIVGGAGGGDVTVHVPSIVGSSAPFVFKVVDNPSSSATQSSTAGAMGGWIVTQDAWDETVKVGHWEIPSPVWVEDDEWDTYTRIVDRTVRMLHGVKCTSGPLVQQKFMRGSQTPDGYAAWGYIVEFTLTAEEPELYGLPYDPAITEWGNTAFVDDPTNLIAYPSAEAAGAAAVVARNFSQNPSVETNATGWAATSTVLTPAATGARSTELKASGAASFKVACTATNTSANGTLVAYQDVGVTATLGPRPRFSVSIWAALVKTSGTAVMGALTVKVEWRTAAGTVLRTDTIGTIAAAGGVAAKSSILPPDATVAIARVIVTGAVTSWSTGAVLALYADALAVTTP